MEVVVYAAMAADNGDDLRSPARGSSSRIVEQGQPRSDEQPEQLPSGSTESEEPGKPESAAPLAPGSPGSSALSQKAPEKTERIEFLTGDALARLLAPVEDEGVVEDVLGRAEKQLSAEDVHAAKLDARATALFGAAGFSMTVAFSFGGWSLLDNARKVPHGHGIAVAFVVVLALGVVSSGFALGALLLRFGQKFPDERDVFRKEALEKPKLDYRKYIAAHLWLVWQDRYKRNEQRAKLIRSGQFVFVGFLLSILSLSVLTTVSAIQRPQDAAPAISVTIAPSVSPSISAISLPKDREPEILPPSTGPALAPTGTSNFGLPQPSAGTPTAPGKGPREDAKPTEADAAETGGS